MINYKTLYAVKYTGSKNFWRNIVYETLAKNLWQIKGLPASLVPTALIFVNYEILLFKHAFHQAFEIITDDQTQGP